MTDIDNDNRTHKTIEQAEQEGKYMNTHGNEKDKWGDMGYPEGKSCHNWAIGQTCGHM